MGSIVADELGVPSDAVAVLKQTRGLKHWWCCRGTIGLSNWLFKSRTGTLDGTQRIPLCTKVLTAPSVADQPSGSTYLLGAGKATLQLS